MIDKQRFNEYLDFDKELILSLIDFAAKDLPECIEAIAKNIEDVDFKHLYQNANRIGGNLGGFCDPVSTGLAFKIKDAAGNKMIEIIKILNKTCSESAHGLWLKVGEAGSYLDYITSLFGPFSDEGALNLKDLEKRVMEDGISQLLSELKTATELLLDELKLIKQELTSG